MTTTWLVRLERRALDVVFAAGVSAGAVTQGTCTAETSVLNGALLACPMGTRMSVTFTDSGVAP
jgi:hypothetical protein